MKKLYFYAMVLVCLFCTATIHAQDRYWRLNPVTQGDWNSPANWAASPAGATGESVPNGAGFTVHFDQGATVNVNIAAITVGRLLVSGGTATRLIANAASTITIANTSAVVGSEAFRIEAGSTLESRCEADVAFSITFANNTRGVVAGTWDFTGTGAVSLPEGATFNLPGTTGFTNRLDINNGGTIRFGNNTRTPQPGAGPGSAYLFFNSGSTYHLNANGGGSPQATWNANSTIRLTGMTTDFANINIGTTPEIGNLVIDCPGFSPLDGSLELPLDGIIIQGNLDVLNTNNQPLTLMADLSGTVALTVEGNVNISGNSIVYIGEDNTASYTLSVGGNFNLSGGQFLMQLANGVGINSTVLRLQGNLVQTGGTFGCTSTDVSATNELFVVELNGTIAQTISSTTGTIDNAANMITLRLNNAAGASLLSPVAFGKISWNSANKGILTTSGANFLTVRNTDAVSATVINAPANNGYVSGPVRRNTNSTATYRFPTGKSGFLRYAELIPDATTNSTYTVEYFRAAHVNLTPLSPLTGVSNVEYWDISRQAGSNAIVQLALAGAVPGATGPDAVVVARFAGSGWVTARGTTGTLLTPGNAPTGIVASEVQAGFGSYTLAFGPAAALPIDLVSFNAKKTSGNAALVTWSVTSNSTPDRFEVLRSTDGNSFNAIGTVQGVYQQLNYSFTDNNLPAGVTYYRLRMIDINGEVKLSSVVVVTNGTDGLFLTTMAPTIVTSRARITVSSSQRGNLQLVITDMYGRIVKQQINGIDTGSQEIWLNLHSLAGGAYQITGYLDGKRSGSIRFIKQ